MFLPAITFVLLMASASATVLKRQSTCDGFGTSPSNTSPFTLLAVNIEDESIQRPLALGTDHPPEDFSIFSVLATNASIASPTGYSFTLENGGLTAAGVGSISVEISAAVVGNNTYLSFLQPIDGSPTSPVENVYCQHLDTSPASGVEFPQTLAVNGVTHLSVCNSTRSAQENVVLEPVAEDAAQLGYDFSTCESIFIAIVQ